VGRTVSSQPAYHAERTDRPAGSSQHPPSASHPQQQRERHACGWLTGGCCCCPTSLTADGGYTEKREGKMADVPRIPDDLVPLLLGLAIVLGRCELQL
jgi:hypothetical protein